MAVEEIPRISSLNRDQVVSDLDFMKSTMILLMKQSLSQPKLGERGLLSIAGYGTPQSFVIGKKDEA